MSSTFIFCLLLFVFALAMPSPSFRLLCLFLNLHSTWGGTEQALGVYVPEDAFDDGDAGNARGLLNMLATKLFCADMHLWWGVEADDDNLMETSMGGFKTQLIGSLREQLGYMYMDHFLYDPINKLSYLPFAPFFGLHEANSGDSFYDLGLIVLNDPARQILKPLTFCTTHRRYSRWWSRNMLWVLPWVLVEMVMGLLWRMEKRFGVLCTHNCFPFVHLAAYEVKEMHRAEELSMRLSMHGMQLRRDEEVRDAVCHAMRANVRQQLICVCVQRDDKIRKHAEDQFNWEQSDDAPTEDSNSSNSHSYIVESPKKKQRSGPGAAESPLKTPSPCCKRKSPSKATDVDMVDTVPYVSISPVGLTTSKKQNVLAAKTSVSPPKIKKASSLTFVEMSSLVALNRKDSLELYKPINSEGKIFDGGLAPEHLRDQSVDLFLAPEDLSRSFSGVSATSSEINSLVNAALEDYDWERHCECCYPQGEQPYALPAARRGKSETWAGEEDVPY